MEMNCRTASLSALCLYKRAVPTKWNGINSIPYDLLCPKEYSRKEGMLILSLALRPLYNRVTHNNMLEDSMPLISECGRGTQEETETKSYSPGWLKTGYVVEDNFELLIFLPSCSKCWDHKYGVMTD